MRLVGLAIFACLSALASAPALADASPWSRVEGASLRLIPGAPAPDGTIAAAIEIRLEGKWKTYWRYPGDSGVPPVFDWGASANLGSVSVEWPAPRHFDDEGGDTIGYADGVVLPLVVRPGTPGAPVELHLALDFALCANICMPVKTKAALTLDPAAPVDPAFVAAIAAARASVPVPVAVGADAGGIAIRKVTFDGSAKPATLTVETTSGMPAQLFAEGPPNWFLPVPEAGAAPGSFVLKLDGVPKKAPLAGAAVRLTLSTGHGGVETIYTLP